MNKFNKKNFIINSLSGILTLIVIILFYKNNIIASSILLVLSISYLWYYKDKTTTIVYFIGAIGGPIAEMISVYFGAWNYYSANLFSVPQWLIFVWGVAAVFIYQSGLLIKGVIKK